jgi:hypothetical protein
MLIRGVVAVIVGLVGLFRTNETKMYTELRKQSTLQASGSPSGPATKC